MHSVISRRCVCRRSGDMSEPYGISLRCVLGYSEYSTPS
jgi:hypothetical protein